MGINLETFNPKSIPWQYDVVKAVRKEFDYSLGVHEIMCSGSVGSAKSEIAAHLAITHCLLYSDACFLIGRQAMPRLKQTVAKKIIDHVKGVLKVDVDYKYNKTSGCFEFDNGSTMVAISWADKDYTKFRSYEFSAGWIEEPTENDSVEAKGFHQEMIARIGRVNPTNSNVKENFVIYTTNPDSPDHYFYEYFFINGKRTGNYLTNHPLRHVFYSLTEQNKFLPKWYIQSLRDRYDAKMIKRLLEGQWIYINTDVIYYEYEPEQHFVLQNTKVNPAYEIILAFDFNISKGKPMSSCLIQRIGKSFVVIDEVCVEGARTKDALDEWQGKGYFDTPFNPPIVIRGDATGRKGDSRGVESDYDIIEKYLSNYKRPDGEYLNYEVDVPTINPPIRERHNILNGQLKSDTGKISLRVDQRCEQVNKGLLGSKLKEGTRYLEDQTTQGQDVVVALGYGVHGTLEGNLEIDPITLG